MMTSDRTIYSWRTAKNENGTFDAVVVKMTDHKPTEVIKRVPCNTRAQAKGHAVKWMRYLQANHEAA